ncbi:UDP-glucuronic acid decarboxylase family protein [Rhodococcus sp. OK302]|uniref:UDP-glucuronic acid decarboxylase family protein n=1 Tax=Rhodococcus sp. OK302 TaxID=1882769 RepID=UPI000B93E3ED|nr:UDP-glucuronic acid decarboxylase family protein [Rhodococcus sp. OK302]OYD69869.1 dTDP-glucose 4,6-dehydratase [Rhodococcus sp. OK302]
MRILITGGAGFLGSHLSEFLLSRGDEVVCLDNLSSGRRANIEHLLGSDRFRFVEADVRTAIDVDGHFDAVAHLASPASPPDYLRRPLETLTTGSQGTLSALEFALGHQARFVLASTSEVYGDPLVHPQTEDYWGNVNPVGPRSVYDEAKRFAEALATSYGASRGLNVGIMRIFNTFGPRMRADDGRAVSTFIVQALLGEALTVFGDGQQTRSFCYVDDLVRGFVSMIDSSEPGPVNFGNPEELTVLELAELVVKFSGSKSAITRRPLPVDDPTRRRPSIGRAFDRLNWAPAVPVETGIKQTIDWFAQNRSEVEAAAGLFADTTAP